jgi:O-antigen/teichoic acid export membrane protein
LAFSASLLAFVKAMLQRELRFWSFSMVELAKAQVFSAALIALIAWQAERLEAWEVVLLQASCLTLVAGAALVGNLRSARLVDARRAWSIAREFSRSGFLLMAGYLLVMAMLLRIDVVLLKLLDSPRELATYGASYRYYAMLMLLLSAVHSVLLPLTQRATDRSQLEAIFARYRRLIWAIVPVVLMGAWLAEWIIPWIDGGKYPGTVSVFRMLCVSSVIGLAFSPYVNLLFRYREFGFLLALVAAIFVLEVALGVLFIPRFHALGASLALCVATGTQNFVVYLKARKLIATCPLPAHAVEPVVA